MIILHIFYIFLHFFLMIVLEGHIFYRTFLHLFLTVVLEGDNNMILPDGDDLRLQLAVPPPQLLQLLLRLDAPRAHYLVGGHATGLRLPQQALVLLLQSALIKHT